MASNRNRGYRPRIIALVVAALAAATVNATLSTGGVAHAASSPAICISTAQGKGKAIVEEKHPGRALDSFVINGPVGYDLYPGSHIDDWKSENLPNGAVRIWTVYVGLNGPKTHYLAVKDSLQGSPVITTSSNPGNPRQQWYRTRLGGASHYENVYSRKRLTATALNGGTSGPPYVQQSAQGTNPASQRFVEKCWKP